MHSELLSEFERLRKVGVKFNARLLKSLALFLIEKSDDGEFHIGATDPRTEYKKHVSANAFFLSYSLPCLTKVLVALQDLFY